jgi:hypothetical protein
MSNTFVFRLENGYYYIGTGDDVVESFHGLTKTLSNKPIGIERIIENGSIENMITLTKDYYDLYGKDNVRSPITIDWLANGTLDNARKQSLLSRKNNFINSSTPQNITILDYMISLRNSNNICVRRCPCVNRFCPGTDGDSD